MCCTAAANRPAAARALRSAELVNLALEHIAFGRAPTKLDGTQERGPRFLAPAQPGEHLAAHRGEQCECVSSPRDAIASTSASPSAGPEAIATATARLSSTMGDNVSRPRASYRMTIRGQSVSATECATA